MTSTEAEYEAIVRQMNEAVWGDGNLELIDQFVADDYVEHNTAAPEQIHGPEGYKANVQMFHEGFSEVTVTTEHLLGEGKKVVNHYTIDAVHDGPFMDIDPTGNEVSVTGIALARFEDGKIIEDWSNVDVFGMMQQLGLIEPPGG